MSKHRARKRFGQHFLRDPGVVDAILRAINARGDDVVVEIGPGLGAMTNALANSAGHLHAVELDRDLVERLHRHFADADTVTIHESDALGFDFAKLGDRLRIVGNLPYNISTPLIFHLLQHHPVMGDMVFMLQQEVAQRLLATPGSKQWGRLSVMSQRIVECEHLIQVPPEAFTPPPKVMSSVIRLSVRPNILSVKSESDLNLVVQAAFSQRRKTIRNSLKNLLSEAQIEQCNIAPTDRPERIGVEQFICLSDALTDSGVTH